MAAGYFGFIFAQWKEVVACRIVSRLRASYSELHVFFNVSNLVSLHFLYFNNKSK